MPKPVAVHEDQEMVFIFPENAWNRGNARWYWAVFVLALAGIGFFLVLTILLKTAWAHHKEFMISLLKSSGVFYRKNLRGILTVALFGGLSILCLTALTNTFYYSYMPEFPNEVASSNMQGAFNPR